MDPTTKPVALVTGSGRKRLGWHVADALARQGYNVLVHYHTAREEAAQTVTHLRSLGAEAHAFQADLSEELQARALVDHTLERFGRIDVLVTAAGLWQPRSLELTTAGDLRRHFDANVMSTFLCAQLAGLAMTNQPTGGCIVTFGDWAVARPYRDHAAYFASKGSVATLTRCLAVELGSRNPRVRVNCIEPGPAMMPKSVPESERAEIAASTLVKREGTPRDVVRAVLFLIDNEFVTGVCLPVDGGRTIFAGGL